MAKHLSNFPNPAEDDKSSIDDLGKIQDLTFLSPKTDVYLNQALNLRFKDRQYFTKVGARLLLYINPYNDLSCFHEDVMGYYLKNNNNVNHQQELEPHIFQLCKVIYFHLKRSGIDQTLIFNGDSGSGKSHLFQQFLRCYFELRKTHRKEARLLEASQEADAVFQAFGSCKTLQNPNASKVGKYLELQLDKKGRVYGLKFLNYLLAKNRVVNVPRNESNFKVFYMLLAGVDLQEKEHFKLGDAMSFNYLAHTNNDFIQEELRQSFSELKKSLKMLGFHQRSQSQIFQLLASILHLGNLNFVNHGNNNNEPALIKNIDILDICADFLGLLPNTLEALLTYKTQMIKKEMCTIFLDAKDAKIQRDDLVKCLYSLLFSWMIEHINTKYCQDIQANFIGLLDLPGFYYSDSSCNFEQFCVNYANERLFNYCCFQVFEASNTSYQEDGITIPIVEYPDNHTLIQLLGKPSSGIVAIMDKLANKVKGPATDASLMTSLAKNHSHQDLFQLDRSNNQFCVHHFTQPITYSVAGFMEQNRASIGADFVQTFRGGPDALVGNPFVAGLFTSDAVYTEVNPKNGNAIVAAQQPSVPLRKPSMKKKKDANLKENSKDKPQGSLAQFQTGLDELFDTFDNTEAWFVLCFNSNQNRMFDSIDSKTILQQIERYRLVYMTERKEIEYTVCYQHNEFVTRYSSILIAMGIEVDENDPLSVLVNSRESFGWGTEHMAIGHKFTYLCDGVWRDLEDNLKVIETQGVNALNKDSPTGFLNDNQSYYSDDDNLNEDQLSFYEKGSKFSQSQDGEIHLTKAENQLNLNAMDEEEEEEEDIPKTKVRKSWICFTWAMTWWVPTSFLSCCGRMKLKEVRMAWREKVSLCLIIFFLCALVVLFIVGINPLICPTRQIFSSYEVNSFNTASKPLVSIYGQVFNLQGLSTHYGTQQTQLIKVYAGNDVSYLFPQQLSSLCNRYDGSSIDETVSLQNTTLGAQDKNAQYHDHRYYRGSDYYQPDWYQNAMQRMRLTMKAGDLAVDPTTLSKKAATGYFWVELNQKIYDLNSYVTGNLYTLTPPGQSPSSSGYDFMDPNFIDLVRVGSGKDITLAFNKLYQNDAQTKALTMQCLNNVFYSGVLDDRQSFRCVFAQYILLALSIFLFAILFVKFLASLQLGSRPEPEDHDRFVIINVPCYTEGEESLKKTIDSLAVLKYDDKRKLLFIVADGMVMGGGNDKPTPRIVLDILGSDPNNETEALSFHSLGEGLKQHNMAKVYTGLYECYGHVVPYLVVVKVGKPTERAKPGNRGKRDSQLILMKFFNKVHYDHPMVPLELEMYHQIKNVIGVDPHFYEYVLMVDADTVVMPDSLNRLVSAMLHDTKIMGLCGETALANEKDTWATMIQVYEYYISHHLAKAFESLFGSVTCLPGCFCMYRLRTPAGQPLLVHNVLITDYSENRVDTLHKKNLLHLGEDRYLTTLMLKHFPFQKMTFTPDAMCLTNAPDTWDVLLSQRRRWINSTVHNLLELVFLPRLCGFCCFSMRFVVFMDLLSTIIMPATLGYLGYLLYRLITDSSNIPIISLVFILAPYVLQMTVFILRRQWQHIGWMIVYLLALPIFAFFIPIYSFWHFDDFSWGSTRIVVGENGRRKKVIVASGADEGKFDIKTIPTKKWTEYEEEIWEAGTEYSNESKKSNLQNKTQSGFYPPINNTNSMLYQPNQLQNPTQSVYQNMNSGPRSSNMIIGNMLPNNISSRPGSRLNINNPSTEFYNNNNNNNTTNKNTMSQYNNNSNIQNESYQMMPMPTNNNNNSNNNNITNPYQRNVNNRSGSGMFDNTNQQGYLGHHYVPGTESPKPLLGYDTPNDTTSNSPIVATQLEIEIMDEVAIILENADLMAITKKQVRDQVANKLNRDMQPYKELINRCIEKVLQNQG